MQRVLQPALRAASAVAEAAGPLRQAPQRSKRWTRVLASTSCDLGTRTASWPSSGPAVAQRSPPPPDLGAVSPFHAGRFYQRSLPTAQVPFASREGRRRFRAALENGDMENYFRLAEHFRMQDEPTFCGLSTLAMVSDAIGMKEQNLNCCFGPVRVRAEGLSFDGFLCLAGCNGMETSETRAPSIDHSEIGLAEFTKSFREMVRAVSRSRVAECLVICYSREALGQTGSGHFSPIGGYHEESDSILILDVASFKYPPHWARLEDVARAMTIVDPDTGLTRGYVRLRAPFRTLCQEKSVMMFPECVDGHGGGECYDCR
eukprot:TRINITY_DN45675_c0_g1_i1.p1 TRINITY_DN45675_c0_g1~~TRINITY_DN45675_c0_g1_i1.p1  ORF type:complete len:317 (+),score=49.48 TRINITY_DN45675_c0_g1_i1:41-991(+)